MIFSFPTFFFKNRKQSFYKLLLLLLPFFSACLNLSENKQTNLAPLPNKDNYSPEKTIEFWNEIIKKNPKRDDYYFKRAVIFVQSNKLTQALFDLNKAVELNDKNPDYFYQLAQIYALQKESNKALAAAQKAFDLGFRKLEIYRLLGKMEFEKENYTAAYAHFDEMFKIAPEEPESYYYKGLALLKNQDTLQGMELLKKAIEIKPDYPEPYMGLMAIYSNYQNYQALKSAQMVAYSAIEKCKPYPPLFYQYGIVLEKLYKKDSAFVFFEKTIAENPQHWQALNKIGIFYFQNQKPELAINYFEKCLKIQPKVMAPNYLLGFIYENYYRNTKLAEKYYRLAMEIAPENTSVLEAHRKIFKKLQYEEYKQSPEYKMELSRKFRENKLRELDSLKKIAAKKDSI